MKNNKSLYIFLNIIFIAFCIFIYLYYTKSSINNKVVDINNTSNVSETWSNINDGLTNNTGSTNTGTWDVKSDEKDIKDINSDELPFSCKSKKENEKFIDMYLTYDFYKNHLLSWSLEQEYNKEYNSVKSFAKKDCSFIWKENDSYTYWLCEIFVSWDYSKLDNYNFLEWENKENTIVIFNSINNKVLDEKLWKKKLLVSTIINYDNNKDKISFSLSEKPTWFRWDLYTFLKENWKEKYLKELYNALSEECKKL